MRKWKFWSWDQARRGKKVALVDIQNIRNVLNGTIVSIERNKRCLIIDGKPVRSTGVNNVTVECENGERIKLIREDPNPKYQIVLR